MKTQPARIGLACALMLVTGFATLQTVLAENQVRHVRIATVTPGSPWNILGVQLGEFLEKSYPGLRSSSVSIGGSLANLRSVDSGDAQLGWSVDLSVEDAWHGRDPFPVQLRNFSLIGPFSIVPLQVQIRADSNVATMNDLADGSIAVGQTGWTTTLMNEAALNAFGINYDAINAAGGQVHFVGHSDWPPMMQDRVVDAILHWGGIPSGITMSMVENPGLRVLSFSDEEIDRMLSEPMFQLGYTLQVSLPGGLYPGVPEEGLDTIAYTSIAAVNNDMPEDMVYEITRALYEGLIHGIYKDGISGTLATVEGVAERTSVPFHPGAARYFREQGLEVPVPE